VCEAKFVCHGELTRGARKLMGENLKVAWSEFSTLTKAVLLCVQSHGLY
jgi:hypothetical protein